jgi:two-component system KDP operon response regulator KdpE
MNEHRRILVVDDEPQITRVLRTSLSSQGYDIRVANDGDTALEIMKDWTPDLVITDLSMPNMDGLQLCRQLRLATKIPIIVLSVKGEEKIKVQALDAGADDYVTKPFGIEELLARVRASLRRVPATNEEVLLIEIGDFRIDLAAHKVAVRRREVHLTPKEFDLLVYLARHPGEGCYPSHAAERNLGRAEYGTGGVSPGIRWPTAQEVGTGSIVTALHRYRALGWIPLRTRRVNPPFSRGCLLTNILRTPYSILTAFIIQ